ncbi:MAG: replication-associated recombination protein A [Vampirovibrionales bacterium]
MSMFHAQPLFQQLSEANRQLPLAGTDAAKSFEEVVGQDHLFGQNSPLRGLVENHQLVSVILWGPPGVGKTTLARLMAQHAQAHFYELSAVTSGLADIRSVVKDAQQALITTGQPTVLFIDEIHRYSKTQQDALLPHVENGTLTLMGATTENPSFQVIRPLLSRVLVVQLQPLQPKHIGQMIERAQGVLEQCAPLSDLVKDYLIRYANGDGRSALRLLELAYRCATVDPQTHQRTLSLDQLEAIAGQHRVDYDRDGDAHYDHASAYQKSIRGGDADAALYWLAKMIAGGEDPRFIARRLMVAAAEDVGLARPTALMVATSAAEAVERLGMPEGRIPLAMATAYIARCPKSNHAYVAIDAALADIQQGGHQYPVPDHLKDSHYADAKRYYGHGVGYIYSHSNPDISQQFLPDALVGKVYLNFPESPA